MAAAWFAASSSKAAAVASQALSPKHSYRAAAKPSVQTESRSRHLDHSVTLYSAAAVVAGSASLALESSGSHRPRTVTAAAAPAHAATGSPDTLSAAAATTATLLEWMQQQGCVVCGVELHYSQGPAGQVYRELKASKDLCPGDVLVSVPLSCTIHYRDEDITAAAAATSSSSSSSTRTTSSSSSSSDSRRAALRRLQGAVPAASDGSHGAWQFTMALEVLSHAMDPTSPLQPYVHTLPGTCPGIPTPQVAMLWPAQQLKECQSAQLEADAGSQAYWLQQYSRDKLAKLPGSADDAFGGQTVTQERLGWALAVSMSRAFGFKRLGGHALAPLIDMANHAPVSNAEVRFSTDTGHVNLVANKQVRAGEPILLHYGPHDNANLLLSYGFVLPDNSADRFRTALDIDTVLTAILQFVGGELPPTGRATDSLKQWQRTALQQLGLLPGGAGGSPAAVPASAASSAAEQDGAAVAEALRQKQPEQQQPLLAVCIGGQPPVSGLLLAAVRVVLSQERAVVKSRNLEQLGEWEQPLSAAHEALVMKALVGLATVLYKSFPTSIQQDKAALTTLQQQDLQEQLLQQDVLLYQERQLTAVQFRLGQKLLLEASTKQLIARLQALATQQ